MAGGDDKKEESTAEGGEAAGEDPEVTLQKLQIHK